MINAEVFGIAIIDNHHSIRVVRYMMLKEFKAQKSILPPISFIKYFIIIFDNELREI